MTRADRRIQWLDVSPTLVKFALNALYAAFRILPVDNCKIVFLSRQSNDLPHDFRLVIEELERRNPRVRVAAISQRMEQDTAGQIRFAWALARSLYHLATSKVAVLDSYWPAVSAVDLRPEITVYQLWHSLGKIKRSGKATVGMAAGRSKKLAEIMRIHEGYDYVVAGAPSWNRFYRDSFAVRDDQLLNISLPRSDYLYHHRDEIRARLLHAYPDLDKKPVVLYAPTFRRGGGTAAGAHRLMSRIDPDKYTLVVKGHANQPLVSESNSAQQIPDFSSPELLTVADFLITDYSAIAIEAALIDVPTYYYLYDLDEYVATNGLNLDLESEMPGCTFRRADDVVQALDAPYPIEALQAYKAKYVVSELGTATSRLVDSIFKKGRLCTR